MFKRIKFNILIFILILFTAGILTPLSFGSGGKGGLHRSIARMMVKEMEGVVEIAYNSGGRWIYNNPPAGEFRPIQKTLIHTNKDSGAVLEFYGRDISITIDIHEATSLIVDEITYTDISIKLIYGNITVDTESIRKRQKLRLHSDAMTAEFGVSEVDFGYIINEEKRIGEAVLDIMDMLSFTLLSSPVYPNDCTIIDETGEIEMSTTETLSELDISLFNDIEIIDCDYDDYLFAYYKRGEGDSATVLDYNYFMLDSISDIGKLENLREVSLHHNLIEDISPITTLEYLEKLDLSYNRFKRIAALSELENLTDLNISSNNIRSIEPLSTLTNLTRLNIKDTETKDITVLSNLINLRWLDISENKIKDISALSDLVNIRWLRISDNRINDISSLRNIKQLGYLDVSYNNIRSIEVLETLYDNGAFDKESIIDISHNNLDLSEGTEDRRILDKLLSSNIIVTYQDGNIN